MSDKNEDVTDLNHLFKYLKRFHRSNSLFVISVINSSLKYGCKNLSTEGIPVETVDWLNKYFPDEHSRVQLTMQLTRLARFILLSRSSDYNRKLILDTNSIELDQAYRLVSNLHDDEIEGEIKTNDDVVRAMGRLSQWQFPLQMSRQAIMSRGYLLFLDIPRAMSLEYDFDLKMREYFGINVFEFMTSGLAIWIMTNGVMKHELDVQIGALKDIVTSDSLKKFVQLSSGTAQDYIQHIRGGEREESSKLRDLYALDPLYSIPAIMVEKSEYLQEGSFVVPQPLFLLHRASLGIYYLLADKEREAAALLGKADKNDFRVAFGDVYSEYVRRQLSQVCKGVVFIDFDLKSYNSGIKKPDFALIQGDVCILFEVKTSILSLNPRMLFDIEAVKNEITPEKNFGKALKQLSNFKDSIASGSLVDDDFKGVKTYVKVIVCFEDIYLANALMLPISNEIFGLTAQDLQVASISDIEVIGSLLSNNCPVPNLILEKVMSDSFRNWSLGMYLMKKETGVKNTNPILDKAFKDFMESFTGRTKKELEDNLVS